MNTETLACAIVGHLVGDYLIQNDWMALNKKRSTLPCVIHCLLWTSSVQLFSGWNTLPGCASWISFLVLFATHFTQDRTNIIRYWMTRINRQPKFSEPPMAPWSIIVVDNVWHILTIWFVWRFIA